MKPRKPLERKTPMPRQATPLRRTPIKSASVRVPRGPVKRRRQPVTAAETEARALVRARSGGFCEVCTTAPATNYQHRKAKAHCAKWERWDVRNGLAVCGNGNLSGCHGDIHQNPTWAYDRGYSVPSARNLISTPVCRRGEWVELLAGGGYEPVEPEFLARWLRGAA